MTTRINPETGVIEQDTGFPWEHWEAVENENGNEERINPETGVIEENQGFPWDHWVPR